MRRSSPSRGQARSEGVAGKTNPEELLGAAHSACYSMAFSNALGQAGTPPESLQVTAAVTFQPGEGITGSHLLVSAKIPGITDEDFQRSPRTRRRTARSRRRSPASRSPSKRAWPEARSALRVLVAGASGLIGTELVAQLDARGDEVARLVRRDAAAPDEVALGPVAALLDPSALDGVDAVVNLSGAIVGRIPWTPAYRRTILQLARATRRSPSPRRSVAAAHRPRSSSARRPSAIYGDRPGEVLDEASPKGEGFFPDLVRRVGGGVRRSPPVRRAS